MAAVAGAPLTRSRIGAGPARPPRRLRRGGDLLLGSAAGRRAARRDRGRRRDEDDVEVGGRYGRAYTDVEVPRADVEVEGSSHVLHETRTDVATRGLIRDLADDPGAALTVLVAQLFKQLALHSSGSAEGVGRGRSPRPATGGARRRRSRRWTARSARASTPAAPPTRPRACGPSPGSRPWPHGEKMALMAELTAISLNLREGRTTTLRHAARAEAAEIAALCGADISAHWTPGPALPGRPFQEAALRPCWTRWVWRTTGRRRLKKDDLVTFVAEAAAERQWAPAALAWDRPVEVEEPADEPGEAEAAAEPPTDDAPSRSPPERPPEPSPSGGGSCSALARLAQSQGGKGRGRTGEPVGTGGSALRRG